MGKTAIKHHFKFGLAHKQPFSSLYKSWSDVYSTPPPLSKNNQEPKISCATNRLSLFEEVNFSNAISHPVNFLAIVSYSSNCWEGEFYEHNTQTVELRLKMDFTAELQQ